MNVIRRYHAALLLVLLAFSFVAVVFNRLPHEIPIHWGADGRADGWLAKPWGAFVMPFSSLGIAVLLIFVPRLVHNRSAMDPPPRVYPSIVAAFAGFLAFVTGVQLLVAVGAPLNLPRLMVAAAGTLLVIAGNYLGKVPRNHLIGIRTPWTLSSDYVWSRTHRFAGPVFVLSGLALLFCAMIEEGPPDPRVVLFIIGTMVMLPTVYSYLLARRRE